MPKIINEHIFEIRYKPNPKILDYRGKWAELISKDMELPHWEIGRNRVDIHDEFNKNHVFVGFRNLGFESSVSSTKNYFYEQAIKLFSLIYNFDGFEKSVFVERIGWRSKFCVAYNDDFYSLRERYVKKYFGLTKEAVGAIEAKLIDIGCYLNFADSLGNFNTMSGPMEKPQISAFFTKENEEDLPEVGLFYDIDYWVKPDKILEMEKITKYIKEFAISAWDKQEKLSKLILTN